MDKHDFVIRFAGEGGQGLVTSADALARAAAHAGYFVQTHSTFPSQIMGGPASSQVRISTTPVLSSGDGVDVLVALNQYAYDHHNAYRGAGGDATFDAVYSDLIFSTNILTAAQVAALYSGGTYTAPGVTGSLAIQQATVSFGSQSVGLNSLVL